MSQKQQDNQRGSSLLSSPLPTPSSPSSAPPSPSPLSSSSTPLINPDEHEDGPSRGSAEKKKEGSNGSIASIGKREGRSSSSTSITSDTPFLMGARRKSGIMGDRKREGGREKGERFKRIKKGMMNVESIHEWVWYKNMVAFNSWLTSHPMFRVVILAVLWINLILIAVMCNPTLIPRYGAIFELVDLIFLVLYTAEFLLKLLSGPRRFWKVNYNRFDVVILVISYLQVVNLGAYGAFGSLYFLRVFRALRALRVLRFISFVRDLQVLFSALLKTFRALAYVLTLLLIILYVGAAIAFHIYSTVNPDDPANPYSALLSGMLVLFSFVTADGWSNIQADMDVVLGESSRVLTVIILFMGHFMYENLLAGLMIQYMTEADEDEKKLRKQRKLEAINKKKAFIAEQQQQDMASVVEKQTQMLKDQPDLNFHDMMTKLAGKINHNNIVPSTDLACSLTWLELYTATLHHQEHNMYRLQQLHFEVAKTLAESLERKLHAKIHM